MDIQNLVSMANRIGQFFESFSDRHEAMGGIANHIQKFWEPRMRREILNSLDQPVGRTLMPLVAEALRTHRDQLA